MTLLENRVEGLWGAKQSAKGTPAVTADKQFRKTGGDLNVNRDDGSSNYSDGTRFGDAMDFVNTIVGEGTPVFQAQPGTVAWASAMFLGSESVAAAGPNWDHTITPGTTGNWLTFWKKVGASVGPLRQQFNDCRIASLRLEGSSANKTCVATANVTPSLDPGVTFTSDPVKTLDSGNTELPFLFTEGTGRYVIDGVTYQGESSFALVMNDAATPYYGDDVVPYDVSYGIASVTLEAITIALDSIGLQRYYSQIYGTTAPAVGAKPMKGLPALGSFTADLRKGTNQQIAITGTPTGGTFTITVPGYGTTTAVPFNATAANIASGQTYSIDTLPGLKNKVTATGGPLPGTPVVVTITPDYISAPFTTTNSFTGGTAPNTTITNNGHNRGLKIEVPGVKWSPDVAVAGNPDGGATELPLAAAARPITGQPIVRVTVRNGDNAAY